MKRLAVVFAVCVLAAAAFAQVRETVNVNVVEVPVTVVDSSGNPVRGLTAANFELTDNGTRRAITSFDKIDFGQTEAVKALSPLNPAARRSFMLLFDLSNASPNALLRSQEAARSFVTESVQPRDLVSVGTIEAERGVRLLTAFTSDRLLVESAIADPRSFRGNDPLAIANVISNVELVPQETTPGGTGARGENQAAAREELSDQQRRIARDNVQFARARAERQIDALSDLAKMLRAVPGRKQIVFLSGGFDARVIQGREAGSSAEQQQENAEILSGRSYNVDTDARFGSASSLTMLDRMAQAFRGSDVLLHAIDILGVRVQNDVAAGSRLNSNEGLFLLSNPTGGTVFRNANDVKTNFARLLRQQEVVYVLGFQAPLQKPGSFHNLKIRLLNVPGGARASHRAGYYESGGETPQERMLSTAEIIINDIAQTDVRMTALAAAFPTKGTNAQVPVILEVDGNDIVKDLRGSTAPVEIYIYAFDQDGVVRDRLYQKITLDIRKIGDRLRAGGLKYYGTLSLPPGGYAVKSLIRAGESDRRGFGRVDVVVPKPNEVSLSAPVPIDEAPRAVLVKGNSHVVAGIEPFQLNGQQFIPSTTARRGAPQKVALFVYGANPDELTWETTPKTTFLGHAQAAGGSALVFQLEPADANVASLDITVRKKGAAAADGTKLSVPIVQ